MEYFMKAQDGKEIYIHCWDDVENPRGIVQVFHGMAEHGKRYEDFARFLNQNGYIVYADDHRGHGKTAGAIEEIGYIGFDGFNNIVLDEHELTESIKLKYPDIPIVILGHSFGSFIAQDYITRYSDEILGVILSGSSMKGGAEVVAGKALATIQKRIYNDRSKAMLLNLLSFGTYNKKIENPKSVFAWLSRDEEQVKKYDEDPMCGTLFTVGFYYYFLRALTEIYKPCKLLRIPKNLPIKIFSGAADPVGEYGVGVEKLYHMYKELGIRDLHIKLYPGARHEIINEINKEEVYKDILSWLNSHNKKEEGKG